MQINSNSNNYWLQKLQQDMQSQLAAMANGLQQSPVAGQDVQGSSTGQTSSAASAGSAATASAGSTTGAGLLGGDALNWLISSEQSTPSALASDIIQTVNPGGDSISLQQVASATGLSTDQVSGAFSALDSNGDGQLSESELTTALTNALQNGQNSTGKNSNGPDGAGGVQHHHHHHHGGGESQLASSLFTDSSATDGTGSSSTTTSAGTASGATTDSSGTSSTTTSTGA